MQEQELTNADFNTSFQLLFLDGQFRKSYPQGSDACRIWYRPSPLAAMWEQPASLHLPLLGRRLSCA